MAATSLGTAGFLQGLPDYLRWVTVQILKSDALINDSFAEGRVFQSNFAGAMPSAASSHVVVALASLDPETRIGGVSDTVAITTVYAFRSLRFLIDGPEASIGGVWDYHLRLMSSPRNSGLEWPQDNTERPGRYVEHFEDFRVETFGELTRGVGNVELAITASYRLMTNARERFFDKVSNP